MIRRARVSEAHRVAAVVAAAFATDPIMTYLIPVSSSDTRRDRLVHFFRHLVAVELAKPDHLVDVVEVDGKIVAVAVWSQLDTPQKPTPKEMLRLLPVAVRVFRGGIARSLKLASAMERTHPATPHRYLAFIGVHPDAQGNGWGGRLVASVTESLDEQGLGAYLESSNPLNVPLYSRHGFVARDRVPLPDDAPVMTPMWRDPR